MNIAGFIRQIRSEFKKVVWLTPKEALSSYLMVLAFAIIGAILFFIVDNILKFGVSSLLQYGEHIL